MPKKNNKEILRLENVSFRHRGRDIIFQDVNLTVNEKDFVLIKGPSGSGKSTLLHIINRLLEPEKGMIFFRKKSIKKFDVTYIRKKICYIQQTPVMIDASIEKNITFPFNFKSVKKYSPPSKEKIRKIFNDFLLNHLKLTDSALKLSTGEKQRVALIRGLLLEPEIILLDEPTSALDENSRKIVEGIIEKINTQNSTAVIMATHIGFSSQIINLHKFILSDGYLKKEDNNEHCRNK